MYRGSMAQMADIKDGLRINEESPQPRPWRALPLPVRKTESIARDRAPVPCAREIFVVSRRGRIGAFVIFRRPALAIEINPTSRIRPRAQGRFCDFRPR